MYTFALKQEFLKKLNNLEFYEHPFRSPGAVVLNRWAVELF